jgi:DNA-binding beta-propeller fold protein YncE
MSNFFRTALLCLATAVSVLGCSATTQKASAPVAGGQNITQGASNPDVSRAAIAQGIYELVYSDKQGVIFVASAGSFEDPSVPYQVLVVNPADLSVIQAIQLPRKAYSLALDDDGDRLYVGNTSEGAVTVIDTRTRAVLDRFQLVKKSKGKDGHERPEYHFRQLVLDTKNHRLYMPAFDSTTSVLFVIDTRTGKVEKTIPGFGYTATGIALDEKGKRLYVSNMEGEAIVVDTVSNEIIKRFSLGVEQPLNLAYDAVNHRLLAVDQGHPKMRGFQKRGIPNYESRHPGHRVVAIDLKTEQPVAEFAASGPINLKLDPARQRLFITNRVSGEVTVFNSNDYRKLYAISLPAHPNTLAFNSRTGEVFVTVKNDEDGPKGAKESVARIRLPD